MSASTRPNLFNYATSELSQDAFICWLAEWANSAYSEQDEALHQTGREFVLSMIRKVKPGYEEHSLQTVSVTKQAEKLDVLIDVNKDATDKLAILVEDKTHSSNHSDQLNRYYQQVEKGYGPDQMVPLYFKTGYQSRFDIPDTYRTYLRKDFLEVLQAGKKRGVTNAIYDDFLERLTGMDEAIKQFASKGEAWTKDDWIGFFSTLYDNRGMLHEQSDNDGVNWGYVSNPSGGFYGYWWYFTRLTDKAYMPYLQLQESVLCFKVQDTNEASQSSTWDEAHQVIVQIANQLNVTLKRPKRKKSGRSMTVAQWEGYLVMNQNGLDFDATLANLRKAQVILDRAFL